MRASWKTMFLTAALFNYAIGLPIILATAWSYDLAWIPPVGAPGAMTLSFWRDFGFVVVIIGVGYQMVSRNVNRNHGIVWLGIISKTYDVASLTYRFAVGAAHSMVLIPAAIDGTYAVLFAVFMYRAKKSVVPL